jgi:hypothetical protein
MNTWPEGWTEVEYKTFKSGDASETDSDSDEDEPDVGVKGYKKEKYKKLLVVEELLPE